MKRVLKTLHHVYWMSTQPYKVGVVSSYAHLIDSGVLYTHKPTVVYNVHIGLRLYVKVT